MFYCDPGMRAALQQAKTTRLSRNPWKTLTLGYLLRLATFIGPFSPAFKAISLQKRHKLLNFFWRLSKNSIIFSLRQLPLPFWQLKRQYGSCQYAYIPFETLITILTIENLNSWQSLLPHNLLWHWTAFAILAMFSFKGPIGHNRWRENSRNGSFGPNNGTKMKK